MVDPFPPASPPPPPPPPPNPGQPMFAAPSPGATPFQPTPFVAPPPPQQSSGCFKGCCIVGVILGVIGIVAAVGIGMNYKKMIAWSLIKTTIEPSDLRQDEKDEATQILQAYVNLVFGPKASDARYLTEYNKNQADLQSSAADGKVEASEVRPVIGRIKKILKDEGQSWPSPLFTSVGSWSIRITGFDAGRRKDVVDYLRAKNLSFTADASLDRPPVDLLGNFSETDARIIGRELEEKGCKVEVFVITETVH